MENVRQPTTASKGTDDYEIYWESLKKNTPLNAPGTGIGRFRNNLGAAALAMAGVGASVAGFMSRNESQEMGEIQARAERLDGMTGHSGVQVMDGKENEKPSISLGIIDLGNGVTCEGILDHYPSQTKVRLLLRDPGVDPATIAVIFGLGVRYPDSTSKGQGSPEYYPTTSMDSFPTKLSDQEVIEIVQRVVEQINVLPEAGEQWVKHMSRNPSALGQLEEERMSKTCCSAILRQALSDTEKASQLLIDQQQQEGTVKVLAGGA